MRPFFATGRAFGANRRRAGLAPETILKTIDPPHLLVGDAVPVNQKQIQALVGEYAVLAPADRNYPRASTIARLASNRLAGAECDAVARLVPRYIRASDAERARRYQAPEPGN